MTIYRLDILLSQFWTSPLFLFGSNCRFLTCLQASQEAGNVVWYSHLFRNFPQFVVIHTVKGFRVVNEAEVDVFLEFLCFLCDPRNVDNFISGSYAFSKHRLYMLKISVHVLLKPSLKNFEHNLTSMVNEHNYMIVWTFFGISLLWDWNEIWCFLVLWPQLFSKLAYILNVAL